MTTHAAHANTNRFPMSILLLSPSSWARLFTHPSNRLYRDSAPPLGERIASGDTGGEAAAITQQLAARIDAAIDALPAPQREVFLMREVLGLPFAEIATALDENVATVKSRMRYALTHLRDALAESGPSGGEAA